MKTGVEVEDLHCHHHHDDDDDDDDTLTAEWWRCIIQIHESNIALNEFENF